MSDFEAKMQKKNRFPVGLRPRPRWGSLKRSPRRPQLYLRVPTSHERGRGAGEEGGKGDDGQDAHDIAILCIYIVVSYLYHLYRYFITRLASCNQVAVCQPLLKSYLI